MGESLASAWRAVPQWARSVGALLVFILVLLVPAWAGRAFKAGDELYLLVAFIALLLLGKPLYRAFWRVLDRSASTMRSGAGSVSHGGSGPYHWQRASGLRC